MGWVGEREGGGVETEEILRGRSGEAEGGLMGGEVTYCASPRTILCCRHFYSR
jgi:hypothetical protein